MTFSSFMKCRTCDIHQNMVKISQNNGLYVTGLPPRVSEEDIYELFQRYGRIADLYLADNNMFCLINFMDRDPINVLLHYPISLYGHRLRIRPRHPPKDDLPSLNQTSLNPEKVVQSIQLQKDFKSQMEEFLKIVKADDSMLLKQMQVCRDLENALQLISSTYKILPFGSTVNGLAFKDSDLDIFYGPEDEDSTLVRDLFRKVRMTMEKLKLLSSVNPIPQARVPIIKFVHKSTELHCDLSFKNTLGVQNSKLIKFLISLDERIKPLCMILKYWARLHNITGKRLSNYALILLLINFLQSLNDPILPRLCLLQQDSHFKRVGDWNAGFDDDATKLKPISNNLPVEEIISRFFESMLQTDFKNYAVCPFIGCLINRDSFHNTGSLPKEMDLYIQHVKRKGSYLKTDTTLCIQDPIELNFNVTKHVSYQDFQCFLEHCRIAAQLCHAVPPPLILSNLLATSFDYPKDNMKKSWLRNPMHGPPIRPYMTLYVPIPPNVDDEVAWRFHVSQRITNIFKKVLKIHVENEKKDGDTKPGSDQGLICKGSQVLWNGRDKMWNDWSHIENEVLANEPSTSSNEEVQVIQFNTLKESSKSESLSNKRKKTEDNDLSGNDAKKSKIESDNCCQSQSGKSSEVDLIDLDSNEEVPEKKSGRSLQEEISLSNNMVKRGHALPADQFILDFTCKICKGKDGICIEISDHRSRNNYFSSLCVFLDEFLTMHIVEEEMS